VPFPPSPDCCPEIAQFALAPRGRHGTVDVEGLKFIGRRRGDEALICFIKKIVGRWLRRPGAVGRQGISGDGGVAATSRCRVFYEAAFARFRI
jgi:hypothetical protein